MPKESFELIESCVRIIIRQKIFINSDKNSVRIIGVFKLLEDIRYNFLLQLLLQCKCGFIFLSYPTTDVAMLGCTSYLYKPGCA